MRWLGFVVVGLVLVLFAHAEHNAAEQTVVNTLNMKMRRIPAGSYTRGTGEKPPASRAEWLQRDGDESPAHRVNISQPFYLGVYEVTNAQYEQFDPEHKKLRGKFGNGSGDNDPVTYVTWQQAVDFCAWLSKKEGKPYRLPTEAEWEYACRAGTTTAYSTGDTLTTAQAHFGLTKDGNRLEKPMPVGSFPANAWGLHDMHGNVAEWCLDWYGPYESGDQTDPVGRADGEARVVRGWSWQPTRGQNPAHFARSANRSGHVPEDANRYTGFRIVQGPVPKTKPLPVAEPALHQRDVIQENKRPAPPDAKKPYFVNYTGEKKGPTIAPNSFGPIFSNHNHFSACCVCPNGDVLAVWYSCVGEPDRQLVQAASRLRAGADRWEPASLFFDIPDVNVHAPVLLRDGKRIYHFGTLSLHGWDYAAEMMRYSDDSGATWSKPRVILSRDDPNSLSQPCSAVVAKDGTLIVACDGQVHVDEKLMLSADKGKTWKVAKGDMRKAAGGRYVIHPAIFERKDGAIVNYLRGPNPMPVQISTDRGDSWETSDSPFAGIGGGQKSAALRLKSGAVLFMTADNRKWVGGGTLVALSDDEGKTWAHVRQVPAPVGGYMSLCQAEDGIIYLVGSRLHMAACNEAWLREGKPLSERKR
jgi:formylglycine-generating enzyme required for sulfatase activity/photosystem II stability/assembly factor-like uncharacterized protein